jgi:hypothetical protein
MPATIIRDRMIEPSKLRSLPFFRLHCLTGLLTGIAAGTATLGHVIGLRNGDTALDFHIARLLMEWVTTTGFTAAQEVRFDCFKATGYSAAHTGGTGAANENLSARGDYTANTTVVARVAGTDALTAGTHTIGGRVLSCGGLELADGATIRHQIFRDELVSRDKHPVEVLKPNEGLIVRSGILMGAAGVGRLKLVAEGWLKDSSP